MSQANVFEQVIKHVSRRDFEVSVAKNGGDFKVTQLDSWSWFGSLLFGQLTGHDSIRAIERVFCQGNQRMRKLGFSTVCRSTLSDANQKRPLAILEDTLQATLQRARLAFPKSNNFLFRGQVLALDSTIIELCLSLSPWANFRKGTAAVKLHTAIDIAGDLPEISVITPAICHDLPIAKQRFHFSRGSTIIFDRAYWGGEWFNHLNDSGVFFVTRSKKVKFWKAIECRPTDRTRGFLCDQTVYQKPGISRALHRKNKRYRGKLRRISYRDPDTKKKLVFLTNRFDLDVATIAALYKARWKVEVFFKTLKQHLRIKKFLGTSPHAVKAQIYVALIAYLLVQMIRWITKSRVSMPDAMAVIGTLLLLREPLERLLGDLPRVTRHPPSSQLLLPIFK